MSKSNEKENLSLVHSSLDLETATDLDIDLELKEKFKKVHEEKIDLGDFLDEFLHQFISKQTQKAYIHDLKSFFAFLSSGGEKIVHPKDIQGGHFQIYRDSLLKKEYSSATINRKLVAIRSFIKWAMAKKLIDHNPLDIVKLPKVETQTPTLAFEDAQVVEMLSKPDLNTKSGHMHKMALHLLFSLGLRRSELVNIKIKDFYQDRGHYVLSILGKGNKLRHLPISRDLSTSLKIYMDAMANQFNLQFESDDFLLQSLKKGKNTRAMNGSSVYRIVEKYSKECGLNKRLSPHSCRATAISHLLDTQKTPIRDVAIFAGHSNITTTERYDKRRNNLEQSAAYDINYNKDKTSA